MHEENKYSMSDLFIYMREKYFMSGLFICICERTELLNLSFLGKKKFSEAIGMIQVAEFY